MKSNFVLPISCLVVAFSLITLTGCGNNPQTVNQPQDTSENYAYSNLTTNSPQQGGVHQISSQIARDIAVDFVGYGTVHDINAFTNEGVLTFEVDIRHNSIRYVVLVSAESGNVSRLSRYKDDTPLDERSNNLNVISDYPTYQTNDELPSVIPTRGGNNIPISNIVPRSPARQGGPTNPSISAQDAVSLAYNHLLSIGVSGARFDYVYMDLERNTWVWSVEFDGGGRSYEFYVNVETGEFLQAPQGSGSGNTQATLPQSAPVATPSTSVGQSGRPSNPAISLQRAIEIAYADLANRGINATFSRDSGMDWERGQWVWELLFRTHGERMPLIEFYINVDNGNIVKFEWDD